MLLGCFSVGLVLGSMTQTKPLITKYRGIVANSLLDHKVEHVAVGVQSALEGATMAEGKCGALGAELVKVFRMLTSRKQNGSSRRKHDNCNKGSTPSTANGDGGHEARNHDSSVIHSNNLDHRHDSSQSQFIGSTGIDQIMPTKSISDPGQAQATMTRNTTSSSHKKRAPGPHGNKVAVVAKETCQPITSTTPQKSESKTPQLEKDRNNGVGSFIVDNNFNESNEGVTTMSKESKWSRNRNIPQEHTELCILEEQKKGGEPREKRHEGPAKNCQRTNIRLEAGRIHVNVSHRSAFVNHSEKRSADLIAVQS